MVLAQVAGYFGLIELGVFGSAARILIDHKDQKQKPIYSQVVAAATTILVVQGIIIIVACWLLAPLVIQLFNIPPELRDVAIYLLMFLGLSTGLATCFKVFSAILYANQRIDLVVLFQAASPLLSLGIIWPLLAAGHGLKALAWSFLVPTVFTSVASWLACHRLKLLPHRIGLSDVRLARVRELFQLGMDFFLVNIGTQLLEASQLMIVSRTMGLTAAATWSVSTKLFSLLYQLTAKVENTAVVFFSEMIVRGEHPTLQSRFRQMYQVTGGLAVCGMLGAVAVNPYFVCAWASSEVLWPSLNNWLIAALLILNLLLRCHTDFAMHTKSIGLLRFLFFFESLAFVAAALWASPRFGFSGILIAAIICALLFRAAYAVNRTAAYFSVSFRSVAFGWLAFLGLPIAGMALVALITPLVAAALPSAGTRLVSSIIVVVAAAVLLLFSMEITLHPRRFLHEHLSKFFLATLAKLRK
jgi:O-antigen/teichoic acid export membrane protein